MATQKQPSETGPDPTIIVAGIALTFLMALIFWDQFHTGIATAYSFVRQIQFLPFTVLASKWSAFLGGVLAAAGATVFFAKKSHAKYGLYGIAAGLILIVGWLVGGLFESWYYFFRDSDKSLILWKHMSKSSMYANLFTFVVGVLPFAIWIAHKSLNTNPMNHKHFARGKDYTLHTFTDVMAKQFPHLKLFRELDLTAKSINVGKYRMGDTEKQFAISHDLMVRIKGNTFKVDSERARALFKTYMSNLWRGYNALSKWELAVIATLLPRLAATDPEMSDKEYKIALDTTNSLLAGYWRDAAASYDKKADRIELNLDYAKAAIRKYGKNVKVQHFFKRHAYVHTILYAMLLEARTLGVLPPSEYRWLRIVDRKLWLLIDNVGKMVAFTEAGATYAHYLHEARQKRAIERPMLDGAVRALIEGVESYMFSEDEIADINKRIKTKEELDVLDLKSVEKKAENLFLMMLTIGEQSKKDLFEAALVNERGDVLYSQRCMTTVPMDPIARELFNLSDADVDAMSKLPTSADVRASLLELCNGHHIFTFDKKDFALVDGIERSAASLADCKGDSEFDLPSSAVMEGILTEQEMKPVNEATYGAELCRLLWNENRKQVLNEQAGRKTN